MFPFHFRLKRNLKKKKSKKNKTERCNPHLCCAICMDVMDWEQARKIKEEKNWIMKARKENNSLKEAGLDKKWRLENFIFGWKIFQQ